MDIEEVRRRVESRVPIGLREWVESTQAISEAGFDPDACLLVSQNFKKRAQYLGDVVAQMFMRQEAKSGDEGLAAELGALAQAFSHLLNSASFRDGKLHDFDKLEIARKLRRIVK